MLHFNGFHESIFTVTQTELSLALKANRAGSVLVLPFTLHDCKQLALSACFLLCQMRRHVSQGLHED